MQNNTYVFYKVHLDLALQVIREIMENPPNSEGVLNTNTVPKASDPELLKHYYSQVDKDRIKDLAEKYRVDMDLLGYDEQYFVDLGQ